MAQNQDTDKAAAKSKTAAQAKKSASPAKKAVRKIARAKVTKATKAATPAKTTTAKKRTSAQQQQNVINGRMVRRARLPRQKSYSLREASLKRQWWLVDARGLVLGRMAAVISSVLRGKMKASYTPHMDGGDGVIVVNARAVALTGNKRTNKIYYRHTGYPGGLKETRAADILEGKTPERVITLAVKRMLGRGPMARQRLSHLRVYGGDEHPHEGLQPKTLDVAAMNRKNVRHM